MLDAEARLNIWVGPVRSGKTIGSLIRFAEYCANGPEGVYLVVGKSHDTVLHNLVKPLWELFGYAAIEYNRGIGELRIFGRTCRVIGAPNELAESKIRGMTLAGAYVDEITVIPESFWKMLLSRLSVPGAKLFGTTNPDAPSHWFRKDYLVRSDELDMAVFENFRLEDNPGLDSHFVENLKAEHGPPGSVWYQRYILGKWVLAEGAIWSSFDSEKHVVSGHPGVLRWWLAIDHGTVNPFAALLMGEGSDGRIYVVREWRWDSKRQHRQLTDVDYSRRLREWLENGADNANPDREGKPLPMNIWKTFIDPSAAGFIRQVWEDDLPGVRAAKDETNNRRRDGLRWVNSLFGGDRLRIHESCEGLLEEIPGYVWDPKALERGEEEPLKQDDHSADALRYGVASTARIWRGWLGTFIEEEQ